MTDHMMLTVKEHNFNISQEMNFSQFLKSLLTPNFSC